MAWTMLVAAMMVLGVLVNQGGCYQGFGARPGEQDCPKMCVCSTWLELPHASCSGQRLYSIDTRVSNEVMALDLSNNSIPNLEDRQLSRVGLTRLRFLNLSMNSINEIGLRAFEDLKNLTVLDLSMNHIDYIAPETFLYSRSLKILHLAGNKFNLHVPQLRSESITELDLSRCRINYLTEEIFSGLSVLRKLDLSINSLTELNPEVLRPLPYLRELAISRNPWTCDGAMYNLKLYLRSRGIKADPVCVKAGMRLEKIIAIKPVPINTELETIKPSLKLDSETQDRWNLDSWRNIEEAIQQAQDDEDEDRKSTKSASGIFSTALNNVSPFWFLMTGFFLGSVATMIFTYFWLTTTVSCLIPRIRRAEAAESADANSQRVSLLRHLWHPDTLGSSEDAGNASAAAAATTTTTVYVPGSMSSHSCPGTPPPPYREVMLHRNLYPRAAMTAVAQQAAPGPTRFFRGSYNI